jgi:hypothetical protein
LQIDRRKRQTLRLQGFSHWPAGLGRGDLGWWHSVPVELDKPADPLLVFPGGAMQRVLVQG